jgi:F0F1-type ATP synthase assembly protein I
MKEAALFVAISVVAIAAALLYFRWYASVYSAVYGG